MKLWLRLHDLFSPSPELRFLASGPPFVIRGIKIQSERFRLKMADLNKFGGEGGDRATQEYE